METKRILIVSKSPGMKMTFPGALVVGLGSLEINAIPEVCEDPIMAERLVRLYRPDLVIVELYDKDGEWLTSARWLKDKFPQQDLKVVATSLHDELHQKAVESGYDDFLHVEDGAQMEKIATLLN